MSPDAALFARLLDAPALPAPPDRDEALADAALALTGTLRDTTDALREAAAALAALREGRRGAVERLAATLARVEVTAALQARRTRDFVARATPPA